MDVCKHGDHYHSVHYLRSVSNLCRSIHAWQLGVNIAPVHQEPLRWDLSRLQHPKQTNDRLLEPWLLAQAHALLFSSSDFRIFHRPDDDALIHFNFPHNRCKLLIGEEYGVWQENGRLQWVKTDHDHVSLDALYYVCARLWDERKHWLLVLHNHAPRHHYQYSLPDCHSNRRMPQEMQDLLREAKVQKKFHEEWPPPSFQKLRERFQWTKAKEKRRAYWSLEGHYPEIQQNKIALVITQQLVASSDNLKGESYL